MQALSFNTTSENWLIKYKLYHIPFWFVYHCMWWTLTIGSVSAVANNILFSAYSIKFSFYVIFQAIGVYFNLYYLIPRFLEKGRYILYVSLVIITIIFCAAFIALGYYISAWLSGKDFFDLYGVDPHNYTYFFQVNSLPSTAASMTLGMSVKLTKNWVQSKRREQLLEKEKLETELKFLRYQFNPHFLFNTINSIFFLIHKNPDKASASLAKFSELLRHQLYECNDAQIPLNKEIDYLENFIELEKLRQNNNIEVNIEINNVHSGHWGIAPFILMTFVENAFKHVSKHTDKPNYITIVLMINNDRLNFSVFNSTSDDTTADVIDYGGIGLENVQRRLELLYRDRHVLAIQKKENSFEIKLQLNLTELAVIQPIQKTA